MAYLKQQELENTYNYKLDFLKIGSDLYNIKQNNDLKKFQILKNNVVFFESQESTGMVFSSLFLGFYNNYIYYKIAEMGTPNPLLIYKIDLAGNNSLVANLSQEYASSNYVQGISNKYLFISSKFPETGDFHCTVINLENEEIYTVNDYPIIHMDDNFVHITSGDGHIAKVPYTINAGTIILNVQEVQMYENSFETGKNDCFFGSIEDNDTIVVLFFKIVEGSGNQYNIYSIAISKNELTFNVSEELPLDIKYKYSWSIPAVIDNTYNINLYDGTQSSTNKLYVLSFDSVPVSYKGTINFADGDTAEQTFDYEIGYVETEYLYLNNCTFKFYDTSNKLKTTLQHTNADSYKYAETITINSQQYPINTKQQVSLSGDFTIGVNNGAVAFYNVNFKQDATILQTERLQEEAIPTYKGETPVKAGYVFTGWSPTPYPVNKQQDYTASFEKEPFTITIADSGSNNFSVVWLDISSTEKTREFTEPITSIRSTLSPSPYENTFTLNLVTGTTNHLCSIIYENRNVIPQQLKIGQAIYDIGTNNDITIESNTTINIIAKTKYFIRFLNYDNSVLETKYVFSGDTPTYTGDTPYQKGYDFTGWSPTLYPADKNQDYLAQFSIQSFTIRFLNDDGSVLESKSVNYGETPTYTGATPTKEGYTFNGWSPTLYPANKNQDYTATYRNSAFALTLYKNSAENNRIDKTNYLTSVGEITGYLRNETNIINPSIVIEYTGVIDFNYVYISIFNRYYFVNNITTVRTNLWRLDMSCDTLMTYKETILNYECYVSRNENDYNKDIEDKYLPLEYEKVVDYILQQDTTGVNPNFFKGFSALITTLATSPEVNLESENINITTPFNDLNGEPAKTNIYEAGSSNFKVVQMITDVGAYANCMNTIANALIQDDTKAGYVQSIIVFPIWNPAMYEQIGYKTMTDFYYGSEKLPLGGSYNVVLKGDTIAPMKIATIYVSPKFNNFLDYDPYTTYEIWLPFHGWAKLPSEQVVGHYLSVYYVINTSSTKGTIIIRQETDSAVILEVDCTIGVEIPVSTTNGENVNRKIISNGINLAIQGLGGTLMGMAGAVTGNPLALFGGATMAMGAITGAISSGMTNRVEAQGKVSDGNAGLYSDKVVKIRRTSPTIAVDDISKYAKYIGRPLQTNVKLNTLTGYTIVGGVHIENLATATDNEKTDIENQLRKGVII